MMSDSLKSAINAFAKEITANAVQKGFWDDNTHPAIKLMLIVTEVAEACEADRMDDLCNFGEELADIIIRTLDLAQHLGINIGQELVDKHLINLQRPRKHGKKY